MALSVVNNVASLNAQSNLNRSSSTLSKSLERLSSGLKINRGADGPAALVISEQQRAQITGLQTAIENTGKAVNLVQTGEGALNEINRLLLKVRGLTLDSANTGVNDSNSLAANQTEITNALNAITNIANNTQFGTKKLLDGSAGLSGTASASAIKFVEADPSTVAAEYKINITTAAEKGTVTASQAQTGGLQQEETLTINSVKISLKKGLSQTAVVSEINQVKEQTGVSAEIDETSKATRLVTAQYGSQAQVSVQSSVAASSASSGFGIITLQDAGVNVEGTIGGEKASGDRDILIATSGNAAGLRVQVGADNTSNPGTKTEPTATTQPGETVASETASNPVSKTETTATTVEANGASVQGTATNTPLRTVIGEQGTVTVTGHPLTFQIGANADQTASIFIDGVSSDALGIGVAGNKFSTLSAISVLNQADTKDALAVVDKAINEVTTLRGKLGAFQANTLEATSNNLRSTLENTVTAESIIRDTDFAAETAQFTKQQVLLQAGTSVLQNANQTAQLVLGLLRG